MVSQTLAARSAFTNWKPLNTSQLAIDVRETLTLASFAAFKGKKDQVKAAIREHMASIFPIRHSASRARTLLSFGPAQINGSQSQSVGRTAISK